VELLKRAGDWVRRHLQSILNAVISLLRSTYENLNPRFRIVRDFFVSHHMRIRKCTKVFFWSELLMIVISANGFEMSPDTLRYLYSALFQGFAALIAFVLAILTFNYRMLRDSRNEYLSNALSDMRHLNVQLANKCPRADYDSIKSVMNDWMENESKRKTDELKGYVEKVESVKASSVLSPDNPLQGMLEKHYHEVKAEKELYDRIAMSLARYRNSETAYNYDLPIETILATAPLFSIVIVSPIGLALMDQLGQPNNMHFIFTTLLIAIIAILFTLNLFNITLNILFGGTKFGKRVNLRYSEVGLKEPAEAVQTIERVQKLMNWR